MENEKNVRFQVSQKAVIYDPQTKKFLLVQYDAKKYPKFITKDSNWAFLGGRIDGGEDALAGLQREIKEEAGDIEYDIVGAIDTSVPLNDPYFRVAYLVLYKGGDIVLSEEHLAYEWLTKEEIEAKKGCRSYVIQFITAAEKRMAEIAYLPDLQRLQADFSNYKKRQQESQKELAGYLIEKLVMDITPVLDNFQMATNHVPADAANSPWVTGIQYIEKQLEKVLTDNGMQILEAKEGDVFDPRMHEAISEEEKVAAEGEDALTENEAPQQQTIAKVLQKGYKIGEKVIRPTKVVVR